MLNLIFKVKMHDYDQINYVPIFAVAGKVEEVLGEFSLRQPNLNPIGIVYPYSARAFLNLFRPGEGC